MARSTHTYMILRISKEAFEEIKEKLRRAGYANQFHEQNGEVVVDLRGIAVAAQKEKSTSG